MHELNEVLEYSRRITEISYRILELEEKCRSPKNQLITGMPRSKGCGGTTEDTIAKIEILKNKRMQLIAKQGEWWLKAVNILESNGISREYIDLMFHRFFIGAKWEECAERMDKEYPGRNWNENKCFRVYRSILKRCLHN